MNHKTGKQCSNVSLETPAAKEAARKSDQKAAPDHGEDFAISSDLVINAAIYLIAALIAWIGKVRK